MVNCPADFNCSNHAKKLTQTQVQKHVAEIHVL